VAAEYRAGDRVTIGDGPLEGLIGQLLAIDRPSDTAQVQAWITQRGQPRRAIAVVTLSRLQWADADVSEAERAGFTRRRGRPRVISDEKIETMRAMYDSGLYSHADIAQALRISKSSVAHHLRTVNPRVERRGSAE
jgi:hypothetical protein